MFNSAVSHDTSKDYPPFFKIAVPTNAEGQVTAGIFDADGNPSTWAEFLDNLGNCEACCIFKVPAVYFMPKAFGITVQLYSLQYFPRAFSSKNPVCPQPRKRSNEGCAGEPDAKSPRMDEEITHNDGINFC